MVRPRKQNTSSSLKYRGEREKGGKSPILLTRPIEVPPFFFPKGGGGSKTLVIAIKVGSRFFPLWEKKGKGKEKNQQASPF